MGLHFDHRNVAYERFTPQGPLALLPLSQRRVALVWSMEPKLAEVRKNLSEAMFLAQLQQAFGYRLGRFAWVGGRQVFSLSSLRAKEQVKGRVLLLGNAAHSLHPVAGQGFNLTLQDIAVLAELLSEHQNEMDAVQAYLKRRAPQQHKMQAITDNLVGFFSRGEFSYSQSLGLTHLERLPALKREFAKVMMGMDSHLPRLARGLSLKGGSHAS